MEKDTLQEYMLMALDESRKALPACRPNPPVGCVLVKHKQVVSAGYTRAPGAHHAEADAMARIKGQLKEVVAFVTLEPCSFQGRTPSCAKSLITRGISKVYVATLDPHPKNRGMGVKLLKRAGIDVEVGLCEQEVLKFIKPYLIQE